MAEVAGQFDSSIPTKIDTNKVSRRNDVLDDSRKAWANLSEMSKFGFPLILASTIGKTIFDIPPEFAAIGLLSLWGGVGKSFYDAFHSAPVENTITNNSLGYTATKFYYKGKESLKTSGIEVKNGDALVYVSFPKVTIKEGKDPKSYKQIKEHEEKLRKATFKDLKGKLKDIDFKYLVFEIPLSRTNESDKRKEFATLSEVVKDRDVIIRDPEKKVALLSKEEFNELLTAPNDLFLRLCKELGDTPLAEYLRLLRTSKGEDRLVIEGQFRKFINQLVWNQVTSYFNDPIVEMSKVGEFQTPIRKKMYQNISLHAAKDGTLFSRFMRPDGGVSDVKVEKLLSLQNKSIEEMLNERSPYKRGQIAFCIYELLREHKIDDLITDEAISEDEIFEAITKNDTEKKRGTQLSQEVSISKTYLHSLKDWQHTVRSVLLGSLLLFSGSEIFSGNSLFNQLKQDFGTKTAQSIGMELSNMQIVKKSNDGITSNPNSSQDIKSANKHTIISSPEEPKNLGVDFPNGENVDILHGLEWKVTSRGMSASGYFATSTSSQFNEDGTWLVTTKRASKVDFPKDISSVKIISLQRRIPIDRFSGSRFKIPIKDGTTVGAVSLQDKEKKDIAFNAYRLIDNTIEIEILGDLLESPAWADISVSLIPSTEFPVKAAERMNPIDKNKLDPEVKVAIEKFRNDKDPIERIREYVFKTHNYSFRPPGRDRLANSKTIEERVNAIAAMPGCICGICNTESVLLSSVYDEDNNYTNLAFGFLAGNGINPAFAGGDFLLTETYHAFGIKNNGAISDSTPSIIATDTYTRLYFELNGNERFTYQENKNPIPPSLSISPDSSFTAGRIPTATPQSIQTPIATATPFRIESKTEPTATPKKVNTPAPTPTQTTTANSANYSQNEMATPYPTATLRPYLPTISPQEKPAQAIPTPSKQIEPTPMPVFRPQVMSEWDDTLAKIAEDAESKTSEERTELILGGLTIIGSSYLGLRRSGALVRRLIQVNDFEELKEKVVLKLVHENELKTAYQFFSWLSFSDLSAPAHSDTHYPEGKAQLLKRIRDNINLDRIHAYIDDPGRFEQLAQLSSDAIISNRIIALYLK